MRKYSERGFKNLEFLRFLLIFAVVGVHLAYLNLSSTEEYSWLVKWGAGWPAVEMFFLMSGFFLFYKLNTEETVLHFALRKWLRLAPFVIALTIIGYIATGFNISQYPLSVNIFNSLLLLDWNTHHFGPDATILYVAWFVNVLFFVSVIYFCIFKALKLERGKSCDRSNLLYLSIHVLKTHVHHSAIYLSTCKSFCLCRFWLPLK